MVVTSFPPATTPAHLVGASASNPIVPGLSSVPTPAVATHTAPTPSSNDFSTCMMYKGLLHEHIQKESLPFATYKTVNEGSAHGPRFRSTVYIGEEQFTSPDVFLRRKEAEQDAAKVALQSLCARIKAEDFSLIHEGSLLCKSILYEYAVKRQLEIPVYNTFESPGPIFLSSIVFNGVTYVGKNARNKKEAEQLAAHAALLALIGSADSTSRTILSKVISSKKKAFAALPKNNNLQNGESSTAPMGNANVPIVAIPQLHPPQHAFAAMPTREEAVEEPQITSVPVLTTVKQSPNIPHNHVFYVPKQEAVEGRIELPIAFVPPNVGPSARSAKRKKKIKKKAAKKMRMEAVQEGTKPPDAVVLL